MDSGKIVFSINEHCQIVFLALYNCLLSSGKLSSERWRIVFSKNKAVDNCHLKKMSTAKLSSEYWTIVFFKNENGTIFQKSKCNFRKSLTPKCNSMQGSTTRHYHHHHSGHSKKENQLSDQMTHEF